jgi:hypothetical protein
MAIKPKKVEKSKTSVWRILSAVGSIVLFGGYLIFHANFVTGRSLLLAFPGWEVTYRGCWPNPFGGTWVSVVTLMPIEGEEEEAFHFESLTIDIPIFQFYRSGFSKKFADRMKAISDIELEFKGGSGSLSWPLSNELYFFGNASAAPFEAEGCLEDSLWASEELAGMGLQAEPTEFRMAWHREDDSLIKEQSIHTPGVGRVGYREKQVMHDEFPLFSLIETDANELVNSEWHVQDEGFVAARNRFCAQKDGIDSTQFVDRHLATVQRLLAALGLKADESTQSAYRKYVEQGGSLDLLVNYSPAIDAAVYEDDDLSRWMDRTYGQLTAGGRNHRLGMSVIEMQPFSEADENLTTFAALQKEQARRAPSAQADGVEQVVAAPGARPAATIATATAAAATPEVLRSSATDVVERPDTILEYRKLAAEVGQRFKLYSEGKSPMRVEVVGMQDGLVKVRRYVRSGWLEHTIAKAGFERAERIR